ncbi:MULTISPECIES: VOC family protein [Priestia]|jgi:lactoylglutathione lyase|uniref:Glyoxylase family protein n=3 Tax=Priestia TaxID=2800373 RepID=D5DUM4_PRIM1|nr:MULTISPECIES: VOC family protein [Priestia]AVX10776.1 VOC family protein [Bacillus sp. Y-01]KOP76841.1 glyoxalase [Bacillus sp. FJAT-21351]KQU18359.1 glyoxalase [Bacillus sp. Leaf75]KRF47691.1 glyoxalase [Bacillus sp. Soil531]MBZ5482040.1 VOC family protein [Bacillus sp. T_4]MCF6798781.1 VOC family protein [Bacillus sp. ET1]MCJ7984293.1 VOC family protein [Priestia sp. OVL9]MDH6652076.1 lactoylglutathione lyase [Bacillus sp. PvP124]MDP9578642.1 lactoylglutathione lyase [Bacillus sp. 175
MTILKFEHVGVQVKDIEESIEFYTQKVGLELIEKLPHTDPSLKLAFLGLEGNVIVELIQGYNSSLPNEGKVHHFALAVDGIEEEFERLKSAGVSFVEENIVTLPNGARYLFFYGPDKEWIEYYEVKR